MAKASQLFIDSDLMKCLAPIHIHLEVCKRSDAALHNFGLLCRQGDLAHCMSQARALFKAEGEADISLCVDNARRQQINQEVNRARAPPDARELKGVDGTMLLYNSCPLISIKTKHGTVNAIWYTVTDVGERLHLLSERGETVSLTYEQAAECVTLRHAMTVHTSL